jgi:hypothetical protein
MPRDRAPQPTEVLSPLSVADVVGQELVLGRRRRRRVGGRHAYELRAGDEVLGRLWLRHRPIGGADAQTAEGSWRFGRTGFFRQEVEVSERGTGHWRGTVQRNAFWRNARMHLDGRDLVWSGRGWAGRESALHDGDVPLLRLRSRPMSAPRRVTVLVERPAAGLPGLPMLVLLCCHLVLIADEEGAV